jgi:hypothetical protein
LFFYDCSAIFRYVYIFWLKNPAAFHDSFWWTFEKPRFRFVRPNSADINVPGTDVKICARKLAILTQITVI